MFMPPPRTRYILKNTLTNEWIEIGSHDFTALLWPKTWIPTRLRTWGMVPAGWKLEILSPNSKKTFEPGLEKKLDDLEPALQQQIAKLSEKIPFDFPLLVNF